MDDLKLYTHDTEVKASGLFLVGSVGEEKAVVWKLADSAFSPISVTNGVTLAMSLKTFWTSVSLISKTSHVLSRFTSW